MFKKALIASAVLAATSTVAFANGGTYTPVPAEPAHVSDCYIGIAISADAGIFDVKDRFRAFDAWHTDRLEFQEIHDWDQGLQGVDGEIYAGVGWLFDDHYYLGGEVFASVTSNDGDHENFFEEPGEFSQTFHQEVDVDHTYGISFIPGIKISDSTLLYGRIGWEASRFKYREHLVQSPVFDGGPFPFDDTSRTEGGLQLGVGLRAMVTNNVDIRGEYDWNRYSSFNGHVTSAGPIELPDASQAQGGHHHDEFIVRRDVRVRPTIHQFKLGVSYHFFA